MLKLYFQLTTSGTASYDLATLKFSKKKKKKHFMITDSVYML